MSSIHSNTLCRYIYSQCDLFPCVLRAFSFTLQFALGELNLMSLEQVERDVNTPPSLINLIVKEGHYFFSILWQLGKGYTDHIG